MRDDDDDDDDQSFDALLKRPKEEAQDEDMKSLIPDVSSLTRVPDHAIVELPERPSRGRAGREVQLCSNSFEVSLAVSDVVEYAMKFDPPIPRDDRAQREECVRSFHAQIVEHLGTYLFENTRLYCLGDRPSSDPDAIQGEFVFEQRGAKITLTRTRSIDMNSARYEEFNAIVHFLLQKFLRLADMTRLGLNYFENSKFDDMSLHLDESQGCPPLQLLKGYSISIEQAEHRFQLVVDVSHRTIYEKTCAELIDDMYYGDARWVQDKSRRSGERLRSDDFQKAVQKEFVDRVVFVKKVQRRSYRVHEIDWDKNINDTFVWTRKDDEKGEVVSFKDYYRRQYHLELKWKEQGMIVHFPKRGRTRRQRRKGPDKIYLPMELCFITGQPRKIKEDNRHPARNQILRLASQSPQQRLDRVSDIAKKLSRVTISDPSSSNSSSSSSSARPHSEAEQKQLSLTVTPRPTKLTGRVLDTYNLSVNDGRQTKSVSGKRDLGNALRANDFFFPSSPLVVRNWLLFHEYRDQRCAQDLQGLLLKYGRSSRLMEDEPRVTIVDSGNPKTASFRWRGTIEEVLKEERYRVDLVVAVLPTANAEVIRGAVKAATCLAPRLIPSQCVSVNTLLSNKVKNAATQCTFRQIVTKIGGVPWRVQWHETDRFRPGRLQGRPFNTWRQAILNDLKFHNISEDWATLASNWADWRRLIHTIEPQRLRRSSRSRHPVDRLSY